MAVMEIRTIGDDVLRQVAEPVRKVNKDVKALIEDMFDTMYAANGVGLAAPQVGISKRIIVIDVGDNSPIALVNPILVKGWDEIDDRTETRRKLVDTEMRRREKMQYLVMVEDALKDYMALGRTIRFAIAEADIPEEAKQVILGTIQDGFARHMQIGAPGGADADA